MGKIRASKNADILKIVDRIYAYQKFEPEHADIFGLSFSTIRISFFLPSGEKFAMASPWKRCFGCRYIRLSFSYRPKKNSPWVRPWGKVFWLSNGGLWLVIPQAGKILRPTGNLL